MVYVFQSQCHINFVFIHASYNYIHNYCIHVEITYKCVLIRVKINLLYNNNLL